MKYCRHRGCTSVSRLTPTLMLVYCGDGEAIPVITPLAVD